MNARPGAILSGAENSVPAAERPGGQAKFPAEPAVFNDKHVGGTGDENILERDQ